jgi:hypothetical protein
MVGLSPPRSEGPAQAIGHSIDLARHDEIVLMQSFDFFGAQENSHITPTETNVRVVAFAFGELADFLNKGQRTPEIAESKGPLDAQGVLAQLPIGSLLLKVLSFLTRERRDAATTRRACLPSEGLGHVIVLKPTPAYLRTDAHSGVQTKPRRWVGA